MTFRELITKWHNGIYRGASKKLADKIGKSDTIISFLVNDPDYPVSLELIRLIAKALNLPESTVSACFPQLGRRAPSSHSFTAEPGPRFVDVYPTSGLKISQVPFFGDVCAGGTNFAFDAIPESYTTIYMPLPSGRRIGAWRVSGDCMDDATPEAIHEGDTVLVVEQDHAEAGDTVIAMLDGEITIKELKHVDGHVELKPRNPKHKTIVVKTEDFKILGVVWRSFHDFKKR